MKGRWFYDQFFDCTQSAHTTSDLTWQADMAKLRPNGKVVDYNQPSPVRCLYGPSPTIQPIYCFFSLSFGCLLWVFCSPFQFWASRCLRSIYLLDFVLFVIQFFLACSIMKAQIYLIQYTFRPVFHLGQASLFQIQMTAQT